MNPLIFREYDIRGIVDSDLTDEVVNNIGRAYGTYVRKADKQNVAIGGDCRLSTERFRAALIEGILSTGCDVVDVGVCTTPVLYFTLVHLKMDGGIMITGSHNPANYNGFKLCLGDSTLHGKKIQELREIIEKGDFATGSGKASTHNIIPEYQKYLVGKFDFSKKSAHCDRCGERYCW